MRQYMCYKISADQYLEKQGLLVTRLRYLIYFILYDTQSFFKKNQYFIIQNMMVDYDSYFVTTYIILNKKKKRKEKKTKK